LVAGLMDCMGLSPLLRLSERFRAELGGRRLGPWRSLCPEEGVHQWQGTLWGWKSVVDKQTCHRLA